MAIEPKLEIKQSQSLLMTPQLRQAINLLQMSNLELNNLIEEELASNPLLEREENRLNEYSSEEKNIDNYDEDRNTSVETEENFKLDIDYDNAYGDDYGSDREGYEISEQYSWEDYSLKKNINQIANPDFDFIEQRLKSEKTLYEIIKEQIDINFKSNKQKLIAIILTESLDDSGYFRGNTKEISQKIKVPENEIQHILEKMKTFEPSGIFAENLRECIKLQLKEREELSPLMETLLTHLEMLGEGKYKELLKLLHINSEELENLLKKIRSVNPKPASAYQNTNTQYIIPDVFVRRNKHGIYTVELNNLSLPKLLINKEYSRQISQHDLKNKNTQRYLRSQLGNASFLIKSLNQRANTILKVSEEIVKAQYEFFEKGINYLRPLTLKNIAENTELHESTVSRVTNNKYMHTPLGIFELKYFFSSATLSYKGEEAASSHSIKYKIKNYIEKETADEILSDDKISELLAQEGLKVARRTVAKYRESLGIPTSSQRKKIKKRQNR